MVDFSRNYKAYLGAFGEPLSLLDGVDFTGVLVKRVDDTVQVGFRETTEVWHLLVTPEDAALIDLAEGVDEANGDIHFTEIEASGGRLFRIQAQHTTPDGMVEFTLSLKR